MIKAFDWPAVFCFAIACLATIIDRDIAAAGFIVAWAIRSRTQGDGQ
jgi:hypothetical protein